MFINDGTGTSRAATVDEQNRLHTQAVVKSSMADVATNDALAFNFDLPVYAVVGATEHVIARLQINDNAPHGHLHDLSIGYNGGDTNHNRTMVFRVYASPSESGGNSTIIEPVNMAGSAKKANGVFEVWDGGGSGISLASKGTLIATYIVSQGTTTITLDGAFIFPPSASVAITVEAEESGQATANLHGFFDEHDLV